MVILTMFMVLLLLLSINVPIATGLAVTTIIAMVMKTGTSFLIDTAIVMFDGSMKFPLIAIPLFILAGSIMNSAGISRRLIAFASALVGFIKGGLSMINIATSMFFAEISGSAVADVAALGSILIPAMKKKGYPGAFAAAVTSSSASLAIIIPPSIPMIVYAVMSQSSVVQLFVAGIIPGVIGGFFLMLAAYVTARKKNFPVEETFNIPNVKKTAKDAALAFLLPIIILGGIFGGVVTATEGAGLAVVASLVIGFIYKEIDFKNFDKISEELTALSIEEALKLIKKNLISLGINHDNFVSEKSIVLNNEVESVIKFLEKNKFVYKGKIKAPAGEDDKNWVEREQLLFKSTDFGDDKDRALQKSDGTWTYFASDVAYHKNKVDRKFDYLINILGADHAGYIKRISSSVEALSGKKDKLICKISQLVKLIKDNKPFKMSKRKGDYITVDDLIEEVGKDATRFIMLNRSSDVELDFDFDAVKEKSKDNPLYYVQYCYARISSVFRHIDKDLNSKIELDDYSFEYSNDEIKILKKISEWPKCIDAASSKLEPHRIPVYLYDLASEFHSYWNLGKQNPEKRFINDQKTVSPDKLIFLKAISNVVKSGMDIVGVDTPDKM